MNLKSERKCKYEAQMKIKQGRQASKKYRQICVR